MASVRRNDLDKAISLSQKLRFVIMKIIASEKEKADWNASDEKMIDDIKSFNEASTDDVPAVDLLNQIDQLLYALMDYEGGADRWVDAQDVETKEVLKLKEILAQDNQFKLKEILLAPAA